MKNNLIIDTGYFIALFVKNDLNHKRALIIRDKIDKMKWITTWPVLTETCHMLQKYAPLKIPIFLKIIETEAIEIFNLSQLDFPRIIDLYDKYKDLPMDLADASLVLLAEKIHSGEIVSTDQRDFKAYRWKNTKPFKNLLFDAIQK